MVSLQEEKILSKSVKQFPSLFDKSGKGYKEKDVVTNSLEKIAESLGFIF